MLQLLAIPAVQIAITTLAVAVTKAILDEQCEIKQQLENQQNHPRLGHNKPNPSHYNDQDD